MTETTPYARRRLLGIVATAVLVAAALAPAPVSAASCLRKGWQTVTPPFPEGTPEIRSVATYRFDPLRLLVANDRSILYSADGGCTFRTGARLSQEPGFDAGDALTKVMFAPDQPTVTYALVEEDGPVKRPRVLRSMRGGVDWSELRSGLEGALGSALDLSVSRDWGPLYLLVGPSGSGAVAMPPTLYRHTGDVWQLAHSFGGALSLPILSGAADLTGVQVDPAIQKEVWVYGRSGLRRSKDGGTSFVVESERPIAALDVARSFSEGYRLLGLVEGEARAVYSFDTVTFGETRLPGPSRALAMGRSILENLFVTEGGGLHRLVGLGDVGTPLLPANPVRGVSTALAENILAIYARSATAIERLFLPGPPIIDPDIPPLPTIEFDLPKPGEFERPTLVPGSNRILMGPGERRRIPVRVVLPGTRKVDVYFLIDTSGTMGQEIEGLKEALGDIVNELTAQGVDAHFGFGQYRGFDNEHIVYERGRDIGPVNDYLRDQLSYVGADGNVRKESTLAALEQLVTGTGIYGGDYPLRPGQNVHFRKGSLRVVVNITDESFYEGEPNPTYEEAAAALNSVDALQVGLAYQHDPPKPPTVGDPLAPPPNPMEGLRRMAEMTGALAPDRGADCDGDDAQDLPPGEPLVCMLDPDHPEQASVMAPAITELLLQVEDKANVRLVAEGPPGTVVDIEPDTRRDVDFARNQSLNFGVTLACPVGSLGQSFPIVFRALGRQGSQLATAESELVCGQTRIEPALPVIPPVIPLPVQPQPPVSQGQPNPQPNPNAQAAFAAQRQQQAQLVYGYVNPQPAPGLAREQALPRDDDYAMSAYRERSEGGVPPAATLLTGAAMAAAFAVVSRRRIRAATVRVHATTTTRGRTR